MERASFGGGKLLTLENGVIRGKTNRAGWSLSECSTRDLILLLGHFRVKDRATVRHLITERDAGRTLTTEEAAAHRAEQHPKIIREILDRLEAARGRLKARCQSAD